MKHHLDLHRRRGRWRDWNGRGARIGRRRSRRAFSLRELGGMLLAGVAGGFAWAMLPEGSVATGPAAATGPAVASSGMHVAFSLCHSGGGTNCVIDGDTFRLGGEKIRIADIDTPETHPARCAREAELGAAATRRLHALLNGGAVALHPIDRDVDRYGRKLRLVSVDGRGVGDVLVAEGLARRYRGGPRAGWC